LVLLSDTSKSLLPTTGPFSQAEQNHQVSLSPQGYLSRLWLHMPACTYS